jgi:ketosteroid isomerase-like protein
MVGLLPAVSSVVPVDAHGRSVMPDGESVLNIVSRYQDAWTRRDFDAARQLVAGDIVFRSPQQHIVGVEDFFTMLRAFAPRVAQRWQLVSATQTDDEALVLYHLFSDNGDALACADHFRVRDGRIVSEMLVFDADAFAAAAKATATS